MDPNQSNLPDGSQPPFPAAWQSFMYGYPPPPSSYQGGWYPQPYQPGPPNAQIMPPATIGAQVLHQTELGDASVEQVDPDVEIVPARSGKRKTHKSGSRPKLGNFSPAEDVYIVKSWLEVSNDPVVNTGQRRERFWDRVVERYDMKRGDYSERTLRSIQSRWDVIKLEVGKFVSKHAEAVRENPSGMTDADKTALAASTFAAIYKHNFAYMHCWNILKDEPKWQDVKGREEATTTAGEGIGDDCYTLPDSPSAPSGGRPIGRDRTKSGKKTANSDAGSSASAEYATRMQDLSLQRTNLMCDIEEQKLQFMRQKYETERQEREAAEEDRIMMIKLDDTLSANQKAYVEDRQAEIVERRRHKRQGNL